MTSQGVQECALCASSAHDVRHASVCVNVVIGVLVVLCELHVTRVVVFDAVVGLTLGLIAHVVVVVFVVFVVAILDRIFCMEIILGILLSYMDFCFVGVPRHKRSNSSVIHNAHHTSLFCEGVGVVKRVHTLLGGAHRLATVLKVVE